MRHLLFAIFLAALSTPARAAVDWLPITDDDRAASASSIDPGADAEILFRLKQFDDSRYGAPVTDEYIRIKVYNEKGVRNLGTVDIYYDDNDERISAIAARVIKPDGTIVNVDKKDFYDRDAATAKGGKLRERVRSFAFPGLEPGVIVEYKWTIEGHANIFALKLDLASQMPARRVVFRLKPINFSVPGWRAEGFFRKCPQVDPVMAKDGFNVIEMHNLPATVDEPFMPPQNDAHPWMMFYPRYLKGGSKDFWVNYADYISGPLESRLKRTGRFVRDTADAITHAAATPAQRLALICDYCRANIVNFDYITPRGGVDRKIRSMQERTADDILKTKLASRFDMQFLFLALARAAGIDARAAFCSNRSRGTFSKGLNYPYFLSDPIVAVKLDGDWKFYDPAHCLVPSGKLRWQNMQGTVLILLPKGIEWASTPAPKPEDSLVKRTGTFRLDEDGTLSGDVRIEYSGLAETDAREVYFQQTQEKIEKLITDSVQSRLPNAEVTDARAVNSDNVFKPFAITYSVKVPAYAENTGQRLFLQPGFFSKGGNMVFTADTRVNDIYFSYPINEDDAVTIAIPPRLKIEEGNAPDDAEKADWGKYRVMISFRKSDSTILYSRAFVFTPISIPAAKGYPLVKSIFNSVHQSDAHMLTLREGGRETN